jgi:hypothetical protein
MGVDDGIMVVRQRFGPLSPFALELRSSYMRGRNQLLACWSNNIQGRRDISCF